jgi:hypothetical protein
VQNGQAEFTLTATATFKPECSPPMTVVFSDITIADTTHDISATLEADSWSPQREAASSRPSGP